MHTFSKVASDRQGPARWAHLFEEHARDALRPTSLLTGDRDLSEPEIAEVKGCSVGAVKSRLSRVIFALRSDISEDES